MLVQSLFVELEIVTLKDLILVQRERVLHGHVLNVLVRLSPSNFLEARIIGDRRNLVDVILGLIGSLANELVEDRDVLEFLYFDFEDMLDLPVWLPWILGVGMIVLVPVARSVICSLLFLLLF